MAKQSKIGKRLASMEKEIGKDAKVPPKKEHHHMIWFVLLVLLILVILAATAKFLR